jgi:hypothetical protein
MRRCWGGAGMERCWGGHGHGEVLGWRGSSQWRGRASLYPTVSNSAPSWDLVFGWWPNPVRVPMRWAAVQTEGAGAEMLRLYGRIAGACLCVLCTYPSAMKLESTDADRISSVRQTVSMCSAIVSGSPDDIIREVSGLLCFALLCVACGIGTVSVRWFVFVPAKPAGSTWRVRCLAKMARVEGGAIRCREAFRMGLQVYIVWRVDRMYGVVWCRDEVQSQFCVLWSELFGLKRAGFLPKNSVAQTQSAKHRLREREILLLAIHSTC